MASRFPHTTRAWLLGLISLGAPLMGSGQLYAATGTEGEWAICALLRQGETAPRIISTDRFLENLSKLKRPTGEGIESATSAALLLNSQYKESQKLKRLTWNGIKKSIDEVYAGKIKARLYSTDINNDGKDEQVLSFTKQPLQTEELSYITSVTEDTDPALKNISVVSKGIFGIVVRHDDKTYLILTLPKAPNEDSIDSATIYLPSPDADHKFDIYGPGINGALCELKVE